jgi:hypothetical protein
MAERSAAKLNKVEQVRALFSVGTVLECVENSYAPKLAGTRRRVTKVGKTFAKGTLLSGRGEGEPFYMYLPTRACDVLAVSDKAATYRIDESRERLKGHTVTLRVCPDGDDS